MIVGVFLIFLLSIVTLLSTVFASPWMPTFALPLFIVLIHQGRIKELLLGVAWVVLVSIPFTVLTPITLIGLYLGWGIIMIFVQRFFSQGSVLQGILGAIIWEGLLIGILQSVRLDELILHGIHLASNVFALSIVLYYIYKYRIDETFFETNTI